MQLLQSMTDATAETRWVLLAWAARFGNDFQSGTVDALAFKMGVSKRHVSVALEYLVREGYLWKIKSPIVPPPGVRRKVRFDFCMSPEALRMWHAWISSEVIWKDEINHVLYSSIPIARASSRKSTEITTQMRLVWIAILMSSDKTGYVVGIEDSFFSKLLGMTEAQIRRTVRALVRVGVVSIVANQIACSTFFGPIPPIYRLHLLSKKWKLINLGVSLEGNHLVPLKFLSKVKAYVQDLTKHSPGMKLPNLMGYLSEKHYSRLAKFFHSKKLHALVHHTCMSIIFSLVPMYASFFDVQDSQEEANLLKKKEEAELTGDVMSLLVDNLSCSDLQGFLITKEESTGDKWKDIAEADFIRKFIITELTIEVVNLIQILLPQWRVFVSCVGGGVHVCDPHKYAFVDKGTILSHRSESVQLSHAEPAPESEHLKVHCYLLKVLVPNEKKYDDCLVFEGDLYAINSRVVH